MPDNKKFAQITVVEHEDIVAKLSTTIDGQLRYRMIPIHAEAFDPVAELLLYFDSQRMEATQAPGWKCATAEWFVAGDRTATGEHS